MPAEYEFEVSEHFRDITLTLRALFLAKKSWKMHENRVKIAFSTIFMLKQLGNVIFRYFSRFFRKKDARSDKVTSRKYSKTSNSYSAGIDYPTTIRVCL